VRAYQRKQLKHDSFTDTARETVAWTVEHRTKLIYAGIAAAVVLCIYLGYWYSTTYHDDDASAGLGRGVQIYNAPLRAAGEPAQPGVESYDSVKARASAARQQFQEVVEKYGHTNSGHIARYFLGLTDEDMGDTAAAERELKEVAGSRDQDFAALAKFALASLYRNTGRGDEAEKMYKDLADHPAATISKSQAQLELAAMYEEKKPDEAKKLYQQIQAADPRGPAAELAANRLAALK